MNNEIIRKTATRQKKLMFWKESLLSGTLANEDKTHIQSLLGQYRALLNEILNTEKPENTEEKIGIIENKLNGLFESRRLLTDKIGIPAIDC